MEDEELKPFYIRQRVEFVGTLEDCFNKNKNQNLPNHLIYTIELIDREDYDYYPYLLKHYESGIGNWVTFESIRPVTEHDRELYMLWRMKQ